MRPRVKTSKIPYFRITTTVFLGFVEKYNLEKLFRFNTQVENVTYNEKNRKFTVDVNDMNQFRDTDGKKSNTFDYVVVATGHFSWPENPKFEGEETFPGQIIHSHE